MGWVARPSLPLMDLKDSLALYKQVLKPLLSDLEFNQAIRKINVFENGGQATELHNRLLKYKQSIDELESTKLGTGKAHGNWLDQYWLDVGYHQWRVPLIINSNWWILMKPAIKPQHGVLGRAALFSCAMLQYQMQVETESIPQDKDQCMIQYTRLFAHRFPQPKQDKIEIMHSDYIIVLIHNQCFKVAVYNKNEIIAPKQLFLLFQKCFKIVSEIRCSPSVPLLTTLDRDTWTTAYQHLFAISPDNRNSLEIIENALFCVCFDNVFGDGADQQMGIVARGLDGNNRWFDKSLNIVVMKDGQIGVNGEHSPCDALIPSYLFHQCWITESQLPWKQGSLAIEEPTHLAFVSDHTINSYIKQAQTSTSKLITSSDVGVAHFKGFGKDFMKLAQMSPDTFIQLSFQLTFYRLHNYITSTYETASTRQFHKGRTETCRTVSTASVEWVKAMEQQQISAKEGLALMQKAGQYHKKYITEASQGRGFDRHLFGLRMMLKEGETMPDIFTDPSFGRAMTYGLSTSQLGATTYEFAVATGFGNATDKGYGLNYFIAPDHVKVGIECKINSNPKDVTDVYRVGRFKLAWIETMEDMQYLVNSAKLEQDRPIKNGIKGRGWWYKQPEDEVGNSAYPRVSKL